jgi:hypothetical protein
MEWLVRLEGDEWSLEYLSQLDHKVRSKDDQYNLVSSAFHDCAMSAEVWELADQIVERINGAARAFEPLFRPVQVGSELVEVHDDGTRRVHRRLRVAAGEYRTKWGEVTVLVDGKPLPSQPSRPEKLMAQWEAEGHESDLGRTLRIGLLPQQTWGSLYHLYEVIKNNMWRGTGNSKHAWKALLPLLPNEPDVGRELERFRNTANDPKHAGIHARHGRPERTSEPDPMNFAEAQSLIHRLLVAWLSTKI